MDQKTLEILQNFPNGEERYEVNEDFKDVIDSLRYGVGTNLIIEGLLRKLTSVRNAHGFERLRAINLKNEVEHLKIKVGEN